MITDKILDTITVLTGIAFPFLIIFDTRSPTEKKYVKAVYFVTGSVLIFEIYRFSNLGKKIDETLESNIF